MIAAATLSFCSTQATASWAMREADLLRPPARAPATRSSTSSVMNRRMKFAPPFSSVAAGPGGRRLARLVLAGEHALGDGGEDDLADAELRQVGHDLALDDPPQHRVLRLVRHQLDPQLPGQRVAGADLVGGPLADADVERLARADDVGEGLHGLLQRRLGVVPVGLVDVDVVGPQPAQRAVDRLEDVLAGQAAVVGALRAGGPVDLGEDLQALPPLPGERLAEDALGLAVRVDVGGVERRDPGVERRRARTPWRRRSRPATRGSASCRR